jgi:hypothetical protein
VQSGLVFHDDERCAVFDVRCGHGDWLSWIDGLPHVCARHSGTTNRSVGVCSVPARDDSTRERHDVLRAMSR